MCLKLIITKEKTSATAEVFLQHVIIYYSNCFTFHDDLCVRLIPNAI